MSNPILKNKQSLISYNFQNASIWGRGENLCLKTKEFLVKGIVTSKVPSLSESKDVELLWELKTVGNGIIMQERVRSQQRESSEPKGPF